MTPTALEAALFKGEAAAELVPISMIEPWPDPPWNTRLDLLQISGALHDAPHICLFRIARYLDLLELVDLAGSEPLLLDRLSIIAHQSGIEVPIGHDVDALLAQYRPYDGDVGDAAAPPQEEREIEKTRKAKRAPRKVKSESAAAPAADMDESAGDATEAAHA